MNIIELNDEIETTAECKLELSKISNKNWKRLYKLVDIRCFVNEDKEYITVAKNSEGVYCAYVGLNIEAEIKAILNISKFYYTCDYGELYYNPYIKTIHIVGGDGGYGFSKTKPKDDFEFENYQNFIEFNTHEETSFINDVIWADEYFPEEEGYIEIGSINLI